MSHVLLIVANDDAMLELVHLVLRYNGFTVFVVRTPADAAAIAAHHDIDLVVADERMPAVEGRDIFQQLKQMKRLLRVPFLMVNGIGIDRYASVPRGCKLQPIALKSFVEEVGAFFKPRTKPGPMRTVRRVRESVRLSEPVATAG